MALNLEKQLRFYGAYHHNKLTNTPEIPLPPWLTVPHLPLNFAAGFLVLYTTTYMLMEPVAGAMLAPILIGVTVYGNHLTSTYGANANKWAGGLFIASWVAQFIGHGKFEGRAPALLDNIVQAFLLAPFFVWFEILFTLGYRPDLKKRVDKAVEEDIRQFKVKKGQTANGSANGTMTS
ncbi:uncharacterized protein N0V89_011910 [Didymosphaeria variabile]|uniref:DUF962-domain-containing protein n=1 Tax=Didymosphaeria variabile TaxID=1932322 RepID=A0A9W8XC24_9PLEO|nr:uncharacterized protein N0V89_011910 [Didymosphaeria variabile]KAJ4345775.1 hypothetical protein N0V89_011910 [Didymosphaeria variabile]